MKIPARNDLIEKNRDFMRVSEADRKETDPFGTPDKIEDKENRDFDPRFNGPEI